MTVEEVTERLIDYRGKTPPKTETGVRLITAKVIKRGQILSEPAEYIAEDFYDEWMGRGLPQELDVLITTEAPLGEVALLRMREPIALAQRVILLRANREIIDPVYLFYALQCDFTRAELHARASGMTVSGIKQSELRQVRVPVPALPVQGRIAGILSAYDDLIENCERRIRVLDEMARALYREWFVLFRYPGNEKTPFVESSLGRIPKGWEVRRLEDVVELHYGKALKAENRRGGAVPVFASSGLVGWHDESLAQGPGIILGRKGNVGTVFWSETEFFVIDTAYYVTSQLPLRFVFFDLQGKNFINGDSAVPGLSRQQAYALNTVVPPVTLVERFCGLVEGFLEPAAALRRQAENLRKTRDLLLPRLLSGQLSVKEAA
jgi:type I restriction enzyme S subunit